MLIFPSFKITSRDLMQLTYHCPYYLLKKKKDEREDTVAFLLKHAIDNLTFL